MNLKYIREFVVLTQVGKFQTAADVLFLSQSALSKHIMALEKELGADLLVRSKKKQLQLTSFGKSFLPYAMQLTNICNEINTELQHAGGSAPKITIGASPLVTLHTIFFSWDAFIQKHPTFHIEVIDAPEETLYELLRVKSCDLIIVRESEDMPKDEFNKILYAQDKLAVLLPKDHPLASRESISFSEIDTERFVQVSSSLLAKALETRKYPPKAIQEQITTRRPSDIVDMVENHTGISVMPSYPARLYSNGKVAIVNLEPVTPVTFYVLYPKDNPPPPPISTLLTMFPGKKSDL